MHHLYIAISLAPNAVPLLMPNLKPNNTPQDCHLLFAIRDVFTSSAWCIQPTASRISFYRMTLMNIPQPVSKADGLSLASLMGAG